MVEIIPDSVAPLGTSVVPAIRVSFRETLQPDTIPISTGGIVLTEDDKFLSDLTMLSMSPPQSNINLRYLGDYNANNMTYVYEMLFRLDKQALDYIEGARLRNKKRDVVLKFAVSTFTINSQLKLGHFGTLQAPQFQNTPIVYSAQTGRNDTTNINLRIVVAEQWNVMGTNFAKQTLSYTIRSSDWVNDFQSLMGLGKFLIVEIPQPGTEDLSGFGKESLEVELRNRLDKAINILQAMESELNKGNWGDVVGDSRNLIELFRKPSEIKEYIKEMIATTTSIDSGKASSFTESIDKLFGYASDLHHIVNDAGKMKTEVYTGGKEDAYMVYMLSTSLVNLLRRKFSVYLSHRAPS
jgi:hypothetical protein